MFKHVFSKETSKSAFFILRIHSFEDSDRLMAHSYHMGQDELNTLNLKLVLLLETNGIWKSLAEFFSLFEDRNGHGCCNQ